METKNIDYGKLKRDNNKDQLIELIKECHYKINNDKHLATAVKAKDGEIVALKANHKQQIENIKKSIDMQYKKSIDVLDKSLKISTTKIEFYKTKFNELFGISNDYIKIHSGSLNLAQNMAEQTMKEVINFDTRMKNLEEKLKQQLEAPSFNVSEGEDIFEPNLIHKVTPKT